MKTIKLIFGALLFVIGSCDFLEDAEKLLDSPFLILGQWEASPVTCNNQERCGGVFDPASTITFEIQSINIQGDLLVSDGEVVIPSSNSSVIWEIDSASYIDEVLTIYWHRGHTFIGGQEDGGFVGVIEYVAPVLTKDGESVEYLWNDNVSIIRL